MMRFEKDFRKFYRNKVLHMGRIITHISIGQGLTVWTAALWKGAGGPGAEAVGKPLNWTHNSPSEILCLRYSTCREMEKFH